MPLQHADRLLDAAAAASQPTELGALRGRLALRTSSGAVGSGGGGGGGFGRGASGASGKAGARARRAAPPPPGLYASEVGHI